MPIDKISNTIIPQYMPDDRPDSGIEERARRHDPLPNPLVLREQSRELIDNGRFRKEAAVVYLTGRQADVPRIPVSVFPSSVVINNALPVYVSDPFFARVQNAYALFDQKDYKGVYVDKRV